MVRIREMLEMILELEIIFGIFRTDRDGMD